ncbi:MAG: hypothetical protein F6K17_24690 [Okeania sp. SIO3C4]|nr:hypothetical protein [Okeania sp. SIO3B3]NER05555.1 hypothetical protein [Okeania sp. SIO3C4]
MILIVLKEHNYFFQKGNPVFIPVCRSRDLYNSFYRYYYGHFSYQLLVISYQ